MRYVPLSEEDKKEMLNAVGLTSIDQLYHKDYLRTDKSIIPKGKTELEAYNFMKCLASKNINTNSLVGFFLGAGRYRHYIPASVKRIISRSEFLTSYTPYQPEISQGTLTAMFEFQTVICSILDTDVANASVYDGATALSEAVNMAFSITGRNSVCIKGELHPHYKETLTTRFSNIIFEPDINNKTACVIVPSPDFFGEVINAGNFRKECDDSGALLIATFTEIIAFGLIQPPKEADIICGDASSLGSNLNFGGSGLGVIGCKSEHLRKLPGRICGQTSDKDGKVSYVLTLNAREQHIRREKAASNICTNQNLAALALLVHASLLGESGLINLALENHVKACELADLVEKIPGVKVINSSFFNEFVLELPTDNVEKIINRMHKVKIVPGIAVGKNLILVSVTELNSSMEIKRFCKTLKSKLESHN